MTNRMNISVSPQGDRILNKAIRIDAPASMVWDVLTTPVFMKKWMAETEIHIITDWTVGHPIIIHGNLQGIKFKNKGTVLQFEREKILQYSYLSSLSRLPHEPRNYSMIEFLLAPVENQTELILTLCNFPTEAIYQHLAFYWNVTLEILKKTVEELG
jgi:uncharacterized protein YndB with AHSA1/START domain